MLRHCQSAPAAYDYFESESEKEHFTSLSRANANLIHSCDCIVDSDYFAGKCGFYFVSHFLPISCKVFELVTSETSYIENNQEFCVLELNQEITTFKTETARVQEIKRKLQFEKDKLSRELRDFEHQRNLEIKKIDEERRKLKRDKLLFDKANREAKYSLNCTNCKENKIRTQKIVNDLNNKEKKWNAAINKLKEKLQQVEQEKNALENENLELRHLAEHSDDDDDELPDSGFRSQQARFL